MTEKVKLEPVYDPVIARWKVECPDCGRITVRAKREAALHNATLHVIHSHDKEVAA